MRRRQSREKTESGRRKGDRKTMRRWRRVRQDNETRRGLEAGGEKMSFFFAVGCKTKSASLCPARTFEKKTNSTQSRKTSEKIHTDYKRHRTQVQLR